MPDHHRTLSLTPAHISLIHREVIDPGPVGRMVLATEQDYEIWVDKMLAAHPAPSMPTQLFAYGSLIWKPDFDHVNEAQAVARGWHRSFCFEVPRFRGSPDFPGLMMALDRGGQCRGVLYELPGDDLISQFRRLFRREFTTMPPNSMPRWIKVQTGDGTIPALAFVMNRQSHQYSGRQAPERVADVLAKACGCWGTGAEYLMNTVGHLEAKGIHDRNLWHLQKLVAERIEADHPGKL